MKDGPKAEPSGTVARMEEWAEGGTFGDGGGNGGGDYELEMDWE
jgi:hypothetical protein